MRIALDQFDDDPEPRRRKGKMRPMLHTSNGKKYRRTREDQNRALRLSPTPHAPTIDDKGYVTDRLAEADRAERKARAVARRLALQVREEVREEVREGAGSVRTLNDRRQHDIRPTTTLNDHEPPSAARGANGF